MSSQALYLKWRSQTFEEVIGQDHVTQTLRHALERDRIAHAYLFCGPRGTGKTSTARILAKAVNCISDDAQRPCNQCAICLAINDGSLMDLIEVDAASNTGVDNVRDIRDKVRFRPTQARYKVYVIDEVHMLSTAAFNALLKTLEEPPPHVIFVLATTEPHRIPATVISRCQRFDFRYVPTSEIAAHLRKMADAEGLMIEEEAVQLIAAHAGGAVRDGVTLLDQLTAYGETGITVGHVQQILGVGSMSIVADLVEALVSRRADAGLALIDQLVDQGAHLRQFNTELIEYLRGMLLVKAGGDPLLLFLDPDTRRQLKQQAEASELRRLVRYARLFSESAAGLKTSLQPQLPLELAFLEAVSMGDSAPAAPATRPEPPRRPAESLTPRPQPAAPRPAVDDAPASQPASASATPAVAPASDAGALSVSAIQGRWPEILRLVRAADKNTEALLRSASPAAVEGNTVVIAFKHAFARGKFEEHGCGVTLGNAIGHAMGQEVQVRCQSAGKPPAGSAQTTGPAAERSEPRPKVTQAPPDAPRVKPASSEKPRPQRTSSPAAEAADPVVRLATEEMGGRIRKVGPAEFDLDEPPMPDEPPPYDYL
jgi:DNA polymerase III subunit gamma/tau